MDKIDVTMHGDGELTLLVYNDEQLYRARFRRHFISMIGELFIYRDEQLAELLVSLNEERETC
jgi:hypothetical protein